MAWRSGGRRSGRCCRRLRPVRAGAGLQAASRRHGHGAAVAAARPGGRGRRSDAARPDRQLFFQGDGLAIAAALEDEHYPLDELIYDLADLDAGFRFCGEDNRWAGRLAVACHEQFGLQTIPGYLENGLPPKYGAGAEQIVASVHKNPLNKHGWITPPARRGGH